MSLFNNNILAGASGAGGAGDATYVDDVFSTFLYDGTGSSLSINNGIDLDGEGGAVWIKTRSNTTYKNHTIVDSERGKDSSNSFKVLFPNLNSTEYSPGSAANATVSSFNSNGFTAGTNLNTNVSGQEYVSWTFRKAPGFFDVVSWTGNSVSGRQIAHNLGSAPGFIMVKSYVDGTGGTGWMCYHREIGNTKAIRMDNGSAATTASSAYWNNTSPTSTHFTVGNHEDINTSANSRSYVAYVFAHDDQSFGTDEDEAIIKCGAYTGTATSGLEVNLGFEPQWLMMKRAEAAGDWYIFDNMRGWGVNDRNYLEANTSDAEAGPGYLVPTSTGFKVIATGTNWNANNEDYIYIAIRRPHKPPEAGTDVFNAVTYSGSSSAQTVSGAGFAPDYVWLKDRSAGNNGWHHDRLRGVYSLDSSGTGAEQDRSSYIEVLGQDGVAFTQGNFDANRNGSNHVAQFFKRAPGFFDVVTYTSDGSTTAFSHNLGVAPELMINKCRSNTFEWWTYAKDLGADKYLQLQSDAAAATSSTLFGNTHPTATQMTFGSGLTSENGRTFVVYLFATLAGVSKVGTYSGTGGSFNVDCGFTSGARYVLIKRTDSTGNWRVYDHARGIVAGNDPYLELNNTDAEITNNDGIDPHDSGFTITGGANAEINASGGTYIFLAIA